MYCVLYKVFYYYYYYIIIKGEDRHSPKNYRPITITPILCRVLERIMKKHLMEHLMANNLIPPEQHGFVPNKSCLTNLLETLEDIQKLQDLGIPVDELFLDFSKAFDKVPHQRLIYKLEKLGITGTTLVWLESFLSKRTQRVKVRGKLSKHIKVQSGVPQGSVLGPLLFVAYVSDLPHQITSSIKIFADDTKLYRQTDCIEDADELQKDLNALSSWCEEWGMIFNSSKCFVMHYGRKNSRYMYHVNGNIIDTCTFYKDLGVIVTDDLKPTKQIDKCITKANAMLGLIKRTFSFIDEEIFLRCFKTFVRPILEYGQQAWAPHLEKDIEILEKVQRRATKLVHSLKDLPYEERLDKLQLFSLKRRRERGDMIFMYKLFNGHINIDPKKLFAMHSDDRTRGHCFKIKTPRIYTDNRRYYFTTRVVGPWNNLPNYGIYSNSIPEFKRNYDKFTKSLI